MFTEDTVKTLSRLYTLIEEVESFYAATYTIEKKSTQGELSLFFFDSAGRYLLYLTIRWDLWMRFQKPLWFGVHTQWPHTVVQTFAQLNKDQVIDFDNYMLCCIDLEGATQENNLEKIKAIVEKNVKALQSAL